MALRLAVAVLVGVPAGGCEDGFQPFLENDDAIFSLFGYLDLRADTQWVRVMPVRQNLFLQPEPIDAVVTLEHTGSGRVVTLNDSLFRFVDPRLGGEAFAYNFWTTERLEPEARYRLTASRSDGASSAAVVVMPPDLEIVLLEDGTNRRAGTAISLVQVRAENVLFAEVIYGMGLAATGGSANSVAVRDHWTFATDVPGTRGIGFSVDSLRRTGLVDVKRREIRVVAGRSDWPYHDALSDLEVTLPGTAPSNVENGLGFVGGVAALRIPFDGCAMLDPRPDGAKPCATVFNARSASIAGRVVREPCGEPHVLAEVRLTERFEGGGGVVRTWKTGWRGQYRFGGIDPSADLSLELDPGAPAVQLPRLAPGERYTVDDVSVPTGC